MRSEGRGGGLVRAALAFLIVLANAAVSGQTPAIIRTAAITGSVVRAGTGTAVAGARIVAARVGGPISEYRTVTADDGGRFALRDLSAGTYRIYAEHENYLHAEYGRRLVGATGTPVTLTDGQNAPPIVIAMTPPGAIAGRVVDRGRPVARVWVRALKPSYIDGERSLRVVAWAQTDDRGEFRLFDLAPGNYFVSAIPPGRARIVGDTQETPIIPSTANNNARAIVAPLSPEILDASALDPLVYAVVFHPGTTDSGLALPIDVRAGETHGGLLLSVARVMPLRIRGRITGATEGENPPVVRVGISTAWDSRTTATPSVESRDGTFELTGVAPGRYYLSAQTVGNVPIRMAAVTTIEVVDRDLENVALSLVAGVTVTGVVTIDGRVPEAADGTIGVQLLGSPGLPGPGSALRLQPDGTFSIANVIPGQYRFRILAGVRTPWVKAATFGADDVTVAHLRVDAVVPGRRLEITLGAKTAAMDVQVIDRDGRPVAGVLVVAVPDAARRSRSAAFRTITTDAQGRARLVDVAPGEYKLFATADIEAAAWQDPDVLRVQEPRGQLVRLVEGGSATVTLRILQ